MMTPYLSQAHLSLSHSWGSGFILGRWSTCTVFCTTSRDVAGSPHQTLLPRGDTLWQSPRRLLELHLHHSLPLSRQSAHTAIRSKWASTPGLRLCRPSAGNALPQTVAGCVSASHVTCDLPQSGCPYASPTPAQSLSHYTLSLTSLLNCIFQTSLLPVFCH